MRMPCGQLSNYWSSTARNPLGLSRFKWTKIFVALYECLGLHKVSRKETPITGATNPETTIHKILGNDDISAHTNQSSVCIPYKYHGFRTS